MDKLPSRAAPQAFLRASEALFLPPGDGPERTSRERRPPLDQARARAACAPMGVLHSIVVTVDRHKRRRTWYIVEPDTAASGQYAAMGLDLTPGCKVLVDAQALRPVALLENDPAAEARGVDAPGADAPGADALPHGFNPYYDLPPG